jgi:hypothetical protein
MTETHHIPIVLFVYNRPNYLIDTLKCLKENNVPIIYIFSDGAKTPDKEPAVKEVRKLIHEIDWCKTIIIERETNLGLGKSIIAGVTEIFKKEEMAIIFEDDLICVPGTYAYLCAALKHYKNDKRVMSVTGWTHPLLTPKNVTDQPYFDGCGESLVWGSWARAWDGMLDYNAKTLKKMCEKKGIDVYKYGCDLSDMAEAETKQNIWAVRFIYWQIFNGGLCLRPPWSMVEHIGIDKNGTNVQSASWIKNPPLKECPKIPINWQDPYENPECSINYQKICGKPPNWFGKLFKPYLYICLVYGIQFKKRVKNLWSCI